MLRKALTKRAISQQGHKTLTRETLASFWKANDKWPFSPPFDSGELAEIYRAYVKTMSEPAVAAGARGFSARQLLLKSAGFKRCPTSSWHSPKPQDSTGAGWGMRGHSQCHCQGWLSHFTLCHHSYHNFTPSFTLSWLVTPLWNTSAP